MSIKITNRKIGRCAVVLATTFTAAPAALHATVSLSLSAGTNLGSMASVTSGSHGTVGTDSYTDLAGSYLQSSVHGSEIGLTTTAITNTSTSASETIYVEELATGLTALDNYGGSPFQESFAGTLYGGSATVTMDSYFDPSNSGSTSATGVVHLTATEAAAVSGNTAESISLSNSGRAIGPGSGNPYSLETVYTVKLSPGGSLGINQLQTNGQAWIASGGTPEPEPAPLMLMSLGGILWLFRRRVGLLPRGVRAGK